MWLFKNKKENKREHEAVENLYCFMPQDDITAFECAEILSDSLKFKRITETYVNDIPEPIRRHFKPLSLSRVDKA